MQVINQSINQSCIKNIHFSQCLPIHTWRTVNICVTGRSGYGCGAGIIDSEQRMIDWHLTTTQHTTTPWRKSCSCLKTAMRLMLTFSSVSVWLWRTDRQTESLWTCDSCHCHTPRRRVSFWKFFRHKVLLFAEEKRRRVRYSLLVITRSRLCQSDTTQSSRAAVILHV